MLNDSQKFVCGKCKKESDENSRAVQCTKCKSIFHAECVFPNDNMLSWLCELCSTLSTPEAPRSHRSRSHRSRSHRSQASSGLSQKLALQKLEEEKLLSQRSVDEKMRIEQEFLQRKYDILQQEGSRASGSMISSTDKVEAWIKANNAVTSSVQSAVSLSSTMITPGAIISSSNAPKCPGPGDVPIDLTNTTTAAAAPSSSTAPKQVELPVDMPIDLTDTTTAFKTATTSSAVYSVNAGVGHSSLTSLNQQSTTVSNRSQAGFVSSVTPSVTKSLTQVHKTTSFSTFSVPVVSQPHLVTTNPSTIDFSTITVPSKAHQPLVSAYAQGNLNFMVPTASQQLPMHSCSVPTAIHHPLPQHSDGFPASFVPVHTQHSAPPTNSLRYQTFHIPQPSSYLNNAQSQNATPFDSQMHLQQSNSQSQRSYFGHNLSNSAAAARKVVDKNLPEFDGTSSMWPEFIAAYEFTTGLCELSEFENASRLHKSLTGFALAAVKDTLYLPGGPSNAINTLRNLFGQPEFIINELLEKLNENGKPSNDADSIIQYSLRVENICATMKQASLEDHLRNPMLLRELVNFLPERLLYEWANFRSKKASIDLEVFSVWLKGQANILLCILKTAPLQVKTTKGSINVHLDAAPADCVACKGKCSSLEDCKHFIQLKLSEKWDVIKMNEICRTCLKSHTDECKFKKRCGVNDCKFGHHKLLHNFNKKFPVNIHKELHNNILFKVVPIKLCKQGKEINTFALLDDGSSLTLMEQTLADALGVSGTKLPLHLKWTGDTTRSEMSSEVINLEISGLNSSRRFNLDQVRTVQNLNLPKQTQSNEDFRKYIHLKGIPLPTFQNAVPKLLIGLPHAKLMSSSKIKMGRSEEPIAAKTPLGWVMYGPTESRAHTLFHIQEAATDVFLEEEIKNYFSLESLGITQKSSYVECAEESRAKSIMENTTHFRDDHYETGLLWRFDNVHMPSSYDNAKRRYLQLEKRLQKEPVLGQIVNSQIRDYLDKGYARILSQEEIEETNNNCWHLPVFVVLNPNKPEKVRLVWDAASKVHNISLNSMLLKGPDMLTSLPGILRRFREKRVAFTGDIREMFHRVHIRREDQPFQRFLWRFNQQSEINILCMNVMTFGSTCSPAAASYVLNLNAERFKDDYPQAVNSIKNSHYVDDLLEGCDTKEDAMKLAKEIKLVHSLGGFEIRNWTSNDSDVRDALNEGSDFQEKFELSPDNTTEKVLGLWWETKSDCFFFSLKFNKSNQSILRGEQVPSKRDILRTIMSIFDPLGLISHILVHPRILLQDIWRAGLGWDEQIPSHFFEQWRSWVANLSNIVNLRIPRCYDFKEGCTVELHTFVDSSEEAFACAVYARIISDVSITCVLVAGKSKVAPLKPISMPRLELQAALIGSRQAAKVKEEQSFIIAKEFFWSDSETVLCWLKSDARKYRQFVAVRVGEILEITNSSDWRYVPSKLNVADAATRKNVIKMESQSHWFRGPAFLYEPEENWPKDKPRSVSKEEMRSQFIDGELFFHCEGLVDVESKSSWLRVRRSQAFVVRFLNNFKAKYSKTDRSFRSGPITRDEYKEAEYLLFKKCQQEGFPDEYRCLLNKSPTEILRESLIYKDSPYLDNVGVIRANSRLSGTNKFSEEIRKPIILPKQHKTTILLLNFYHVKYHHINAETAVNEVRQLFVIPALRVQMKKIAFNCQFCKNRRAKPLVPFMSNLPDARLGCSTRPFSFVGIDYFGPIFVRVRRVNEKRWGVIITCLTVRAVHIEIANSLTTDSCMMCLQRFICRRGQPLEIYSDNGKNLRGASKELELAVQSIDQNQLAEKFNNEVTQWMFIPPSAPHMGGAWERLVRSIKVALFSILPTRTPSDELLSTIMVEVENMINSRPLTYVPLDTELDEALTPNHFLLGSSSGKKPLGKFSSDVWVLKKNWKKAEEYVDRLWKKWRVVYLPELRKRHTFNEHVPDAQVGDIAVLCDDDQPRNTWPKVRIVAVYPGKDGRVRRVSVKIGNKILERPVSKLAILDVSDKDSTPTDYIEVPGGLLPEAPENEQSQ